MAAGSLKRKQQDLREDIIVLKALINVNLPKFTINDIDLFLGIINDLFPGTVIPQEKESEYKKEIELTAEKNCLIGNKNFVDKCVHFFETL